MSFGWSVGDIVAGTKLIIEVAAALQDARGSSEKYRQTSAYLLSLASVLEKLDDSSPGLSIIAPDVISVQNALLAFHTKITTKFEKSLGGTGEKGWVGRLRSSPRKIEYGLFMVKQVEALRVLVDTPLKSISLALGVAIYRQNQDAENVSAETQIIVKEIEHALPELQKEILAGVETIVQSEVEKQAARVTVTAQYKAVGEWCKPVAVWDSFRSHLRGMHVTSCQWIFRREGFVKWRDGGVRDGKFPVLWITGIPGSGKTRLATRVVESLEGEGRAVAYFYCDTKDEERRSVISILRTWTWQLLARNMAQLGDVMKICAKEPVPGEGSIEKALKCAIKDLNDAVFVLDGIDECEEETRRKLYPLLAQLAATARVLIISREMPGSHRFLKSALPNDGLSFYRIIEDDNRDDINFYLEREVKQLDIGDEEVEQTVISKLQEGASGMFLWATLMLDELSSPHFFAEEYLEGLDDLPDSLDALYARILTTLNDSVKTRDVTRKLFRWLTCARRPLTLPEISTTLLITIDDEIPKSRSRMPDDKLRDTLLRYCGSLITIHDSKSGGSPTVTLVHASVKDFLLEQSSSKAAFEYLILDPEETQAILAQECLTYISYNTDFDPNFLYGDEGDPKSPMHRDEMERRFDSYMDKCPFLMYASLNWWFHLVTAPHDRTYPSLRKFCTSVPKTVAWLQVMLRYRGDRGIYSSSPGRHDYTGIMTLTRVLPQHSELKQWAQPFGPVKNGRSALTRYEQFMFSGQADNAYDFLPKLMVAAFFDYAEYVEELLKKGMDPNLRNFRRRTAIFTAALGESLASTKVLIKYGANPNYVGLEGIVPLYAAIRLDDWRKLEPVPFRVAEFLLESGADPCFSNGSLLSLASLCTSPDDAYGVSLVSCMLKHGAKKIINIGKNPYWTALHWAAKNKAPRLAALLLENGALVDIGFHADRVNTRKLETPLVQACWVSEQSDEIVRILLEAGASVNATHRDGRTALHLSCRQSLSISKLLLDHGADIDAVANDGRRPLHDAVGENNVPLIDMLIARGAALDAKDAEGRTSLDLALEATSPDVRVVTALVNNGASVPGQGVWELEVLGKGDVRIKKREKKELYWPQQPRDIFEVFWLLRRCSSRSLPRSTIVHILDLGKYWLRAFSNREEAVSLNEAMSRRAKAYVTSDPVIGRSVSPIRELVFNISSHDQGFSSYPECYGTTDNSWTYFEYGIEKQGGEPFDYTHLERRICVNIHAKGTATHHCVPYRSSMNSALLRRVNAGDRVQVFAQARYPGWVNYVESASITVYTTCLLDE